MAQSPGAEGRDDDSKASKTVASPAPAMDAKRDSYGSSPGGVKGLATMSEPKLAPLRELKPLSSKPLPSISSGAAR